ncbi:hypothetical protein EG346_16850 [Chryseobacterium carnipullorum]|uniref:DUF6808 domain-containing protein n=1 Tax=Chryseobacterium carnipullorum TaxID=1124835 RepID=A0A376DUQ3_CHRCU|nr:hypothetical protein [Chryseobacterium carnipullorum]AZA49745.1 hypothetical protein EG346_16850 [Chryseobacterium carnipullorum]AZA64635.1 hypothetical protein EG345_07870 [Chryseobacterium carnipullorum]STC95537.1 Uncharacterised protein [Chryseobacterium carnipullorum]
MKNKAVIAILALIILALVANLIGGWFTLSKKDHIAEESEKNIDTIYLNTYVNPKDSTTHGKFEQKEGEVVKNYITKNYMTYVSDTLAPALNIAKEKIDELTRAKFTLEGQLKASKIQREKDRVYYENKYLQIVSNVQDSTVDYKYNAIVDVVKYQDRKWLLGKENTYIDISSPDKNMKINGVEHFKKRIDVKPKRFGLGIQAGYYYVPAANQFYPGFGVGLSYNLIRL